ncbi:efflux RND transporter periplasmic adaptor subunit [Methyloversatilis thermotolerans]|uniref:efflux RND transporter periplasmic adaptor subunit n=1 Tax=Methyloversatilis thermotolerans TaxID=1346290 RepID=UPI0003626349|nr:efflux RND transporter periplasmic adaptor subunit [Methyloversatilis thermotolerans]
MSSFASTLNLAAAAEVADRADIAAIADRPGLLACAALVLLLSLSACSSGTQEKTSAPAQMARPAAVGTVTVEQESLRLTTELPGRTTSPLVAEIRPQVGGIIQARHFTEGARVKAGQPLYQIDAASYRASYASAQAAVAKAEALVEADRLTAQRQAALAEIDATSQQDKQDADAALRQAEADLASARAALDTARINLERTSIASPISGLVDIASVTPGALVSADQSTALTTVRQIDPIQVDVTQTSAELLALRRELDAGRLRRVGQDEVAVQLILEDGSTYARTGKLRFSGVAVNTATGAITLRAVFDNPDGALLPGMYVRAVLQTAQDDHALLVPQQAVSRDSNGAASVLVVDAHNTVSRREVVTGRQIGNRWLVSSGLQPGERVVVEGGQKVKPGDTVQAQAVTLPAQVASAGTVTGD